ncbi:MAG TPA: hypothetical protein VIH99_06900 [Bdellovibrionota bacterium]|jgi:hypothetical protein
MVKLSRVQRFFLWSAALHLLFVAFLFLRQNIELPNQPINAVMVDLEQSLPSLQASGSASSFSDSPAIEKTGKNKPPPSFSALAPAHKPNFQARRPGDPMEAKEAGVFSPFAASDDPFSTPKEKYGALNWVYRKAQLTIGYPGEFVRNNITGSAQARMVFDSTGKFLPELLHVTSDSPYLRVYVYRVLERTFGSEPVPTSLVRWKKELEVLCFVTFTFRESEATVAVLPTPKIVGNKLFFARDTVRSKAFEKLKWKVGPLHGVLPVPAVGVDMLWFAEKAKLKRPEKTPEDELAPYRADPLFYN